MAAPPKDLSRGDALGLPYVDFAVLPEQRVHTPPVSVHWGRVTSLRGWVAVLGDNCSRKESR